jgi:PAS domain S-box-containing protein
LTDTSIQALVIDHSPDAFVATDAAGVVLFWNASAERIFGYRSDEAVGHTLGELIAPLRHHGLDESVRREAEVSEVAHYEAIRRRKDGALIYVSSTTRALRDATGRVTHYFSNKSDVTALRVRRDGRLVQDRYRGLLEMVPDAIVIINETGHIVLFNAQAESMFGRASDDVIGQPIETLLPQRYRAAHIDHRVGYIKAPRVRPMGLGLELYGVRGNGEEFPVEISLSTLEIEGGRLAMSAIRDISERRRAERALQEQNVALERANRAKDSFLAAMSHELRTPLNAIIGFTGLLLMKLHGPLSADQERQLLMVQSSGKHLLSLINDLLDLARIESGKVELQLEPVAVKPVLDDVVSTLQPMADAKHLALLLDPIDPALRVNADPRALQQVMLNLTNNAIKFTAVGRVQVRVQPAPDDTQAVHLSVEDTGAGISEADLAHLFEAFTQVGDARQRRSEGTGLGLHLSRKLADLMGGRIDVTSAVGRGSRFTLVLRRAP